MLSNDKNRYNMAKRIIALILSVLILMCGMPNVMSYAAAVGVNNESSKSASYELPDNDITISSNLDKTEFIPGESVDVTMTVTNNSKAALDDWNIIPMISSDSDIGTITGYDADAPLEKLNAGASTSVTYTITFKEDIAASSSGTFTAVVAKGKKEGNTYNWDDAIASTTSGMFNVVNAGDETEETEKEYEEDKNTKADEASAPAKQMLQANPLKAAASPSVDLAYRENKGETYYVTAYIGTDKSSYKPGDTVTVTMILANTDPDKDVSDKDTMQYLEFSFYEGDTLIEVENNPFSFGKVKLGKDSELSHTFSFTIPQNAADEEKVLKMEVGSTSNKLKWGDFTSTGNTQCSTPLIIKAPTSVYVESASNNDSNLPQNADGTLNVAFDLKNYQTEDRDFTYSLKVEAAEIMGGAKTDITSELDGSFAWTGMPGIASETETAANGTGMMPAANDGPAEAQAAVQTTLSDSLYGSYNTFYVTLTLTDTTTGETSAQTAVVPRFKLDLSNYTFRFRDDTAGNSIPNYVSRTGLNWLDTLYYGLVAADDDVPFNNAQEFKTLLESQPDEATANSVLQKYIYDLYEPHVGVSGNYGDTSLAWPKDSKSPFHVQPVSKVDPMGTYTLEDAGIDYGDEYFKNSNKTAAVSEEAGAGDRAYQLDLSTETDPRPINPSVYVIMVPTMWQMFDEAHATAQKGGKTQVGSILTSVDEMAYLYDIKHALIRFAEYLKDQGSNAGVAIVNTQHGGDYSMVQGKNNSGYFTTDMDQLIQAIEGWDAYGDCEHVHWSQNQLNNAMASIPNTFANWTDADGKPVSINSVVKNMVVIAGPTENSNGTNGYGSKLTEGKYGNVDYVWGIRTDTGTTQVNIEGRPIYSWLDTKANQNTIKANNPYYTSMDDPNNPAYQICTSEDAVFNQLVNIFSYDKSATTTVKGTVENVTLEDIVTKEFSVESAVVTVTYLDDEGKPTGVVDTISTADTSKGRIILEKNQDGTTTVKGVVNKIEGRAVVDMKINIEAQEDFVGSNNVKTNSGTPKVSYEHGDEEYSEDFDDEPKVNVPIRFEVPDGLTVTVNAGETVDVDGDLPYMAEDKSETIVQEVQDLFDKGYQVNGTLTFQWYNEDGNPVEGSVPSSCRVDDGKLEKDDNGNYIITIPDFDCPTDDSDIGKTKTYKLRVTFEPDPAVEESVGTEVLTHHDDGEVNIEVVDEPFNPGDVPAHYVPELNPTLSKQIDYLGDNSTEDKNNPDTTLDDGGTDGLNDMYRLYLNMQGDSEGVDLVLVLDASGSMSDSDEDKMMQTPEGKKTREKVLVDFLDGKDGDGFIQKFLNANDKNKISVVSFNYDARVLYDWDELSVDSAKIKDRYDCSGQTNYTAGLYVANEQLSKLGESDNQKVVIFLGDGEVTCAYADGSMRNDKNAKEGYISKFDADADYLTRYFSTLLANIERGEADPYLLYRENAEYELAYRNKLTSGSGLSLAVGYRLRDLNLNIPGYENGEIVDPVRFGDFVREYRGAVGQRRLEIIEGIAGVSIDDVRPYDLFELSKRAFKDFTDANRKENGDLDVVVHTIGFSDSLDETKALPDIFGEKRSPSEVLKHYALYGGGDYMYAGDAGALTESFGSLFFMSYTEMTDTLSDYVDFADDPEFKLILKKPKENGEGFDEVTVTDGVDDQGNPIVKDEYKYMIESVTLTGKTVKVDFADDYFVDPLYEFTASFNIRVNDTALAEYKRNNNSYAEVEGENGTDYPGNTTSELKPGFLSNDPEKAKVSWKAGNVEDSESFKKPVVQVPETWLYELPSAGGIGTYIFRFLGAFLIATVVLSSRRKMLKQRAFR